MKFRKNTPSAYGVSGYRHEIDVGAVSIVADAVRRPVASTYRAHDGRLPGSRDIVASRPGIYTDGRVHMHFVELLHAHVRDQ